MPLHRVALPDSPDMAHPASPPPGQPATDAVAATKSALRRTLLADRRRRVRPDRAAAELTTSVLAVLTGAGLLPVAPARPLLPMASFIPLPDEPPMAAVNSALLAHGVLLFTPVTAGEDLRWQPWPAGGTAVPLPPVAALLIPAVAVSRGGDRLGRGGGHYDRLLAGLPRWQDGGPLRCACVDQWDVLAHLPRSAHDQPVDVIATERAPHWVAGSVRPVSSPPPQPE